ncbi:MAG: hypothetical protein U9Q96_00955 [Patescibacteria group bacterium]|nr:hypothetical protein [Patescibacteria group bacterium]
MDLKQLKKIMDKERAKVIIVENGEPILIVSPFESSQQSLPLESSQDSVIEKKEDSLFPENVLDKSTEKVKDMGKKESEVIQRTDLLTEEEMPSNELTVEDLPF